ncbi:MAG TPA: hypothetical protein PLZ86_09505, partial [bacterium]|nr:hypothetical protein [bacterium]
MTDLMKPCGTILNKDGSTIPEKDRRGCETEQDYPECFFKGTDEASQGAVKSEDGWDGVRRIAITDRKDKDGNTIPWVVELDPNVELSENYRNPTLEDLHFITKQELGEYKDNDGRSQFNMICRSNLLMNPKEPYKFFFARDFFSDHASKVLFKNEYNRLENGDAFDRGKAFSLSREEGLSIVKVLNLDRNDIACKGGSCIKASGDGKFSQGQYFFTSNPDRLGDMIDNLLDFEGVRMAGMTDARRKELATHLTAIREKATEGRLYMEKQLEFLDTQSRNSNLGMAATALIGFGILYHPVKDIMGSIFGRVKATNFGEQIRAMLKANPAYDIVGRDAEAIQAWKMTDTVGYRSVILDAPTGEGKDVIVEKMIIMKEKGDPVVPERFRKAKVIRIDAAEFQSGTKYRGTVADKVKDIGKMAKKGPVVVYISEIDLVV